MLAAEIKSRQRFNLTHKVVLVLLRRWLVGRVDVQNLFRIRGQPLLRGLRMGAAKWRESPPVKLAVSDLGGLRLAPVFADGIELLLHLFVAPYPAVVVDVCPGQAPHAGCARVCARW